MALRLIDDMSEEWQPKKYRDTYRDDILARVEEKIKAGETNTITEPESERVTQTGAEVIDLIALLKRSVEEKGEPAGAGREIEEECGEEPSQGRARFIASRAA
jgi:DNA end-binding protein Ku